MSDSKGHISNYHGEKQMKGYFYSRNWYLHNPSVRWDLERHDPWYWWGNRNSHVTYLLAICNPKVRKLQPFDLGTWNATRLPQWGRLHLAGYSQDAESPKTLCKIPFSHSVWDVKEPQVCIWAPFSEIVHYTQVPRCKRKISADSETFQVLCSWMPRMWPVLRNRDILDCFECKLCLCLIT